MLYPGRDSSVTQCALCAPFIAAAAPGGERYRLEKSVNRVRSVKIIDSLRSEGSAPGSPDGPKPFNVLVNLALTGV